MAPADRGSRRNGLASPAGCTKLCFYSQIKVYSEFGRKSQAWDQSQKGIVTFFDNEEALNFMGFSVQFDTFMKLSWAEYVFVSTSLALVIAKFFPAVHNQIVSRATRLEHQSLYWGTVVVSNVFIYGLFFAAERGWSISSALINYYVGDSAIEVVLGVPSLQEVSINLILLVAALNASLRSHSGINIYPRGMAKVMINISFWWSCFCCCVCWSQRCRAKTMRVLVLFSFMVFIHHNIMDIISLGFMMFIEQSRVQIVTIALLYTSSLVFLVLCILFSLFIMLNGSNAGMSIVQQILTFVGGVCTLISVFGAVALTVVLYLIIFFSLRLQGFTGILTGLIPSIALSAASWYIKKRLLERALNRSNISDQPECAATINDGEVEDDQRLLVL